MKIVNWILVVLVLAAFVAGWIAYPHLPMLVASHWDAAGNVNGYTGRFGGAFMLPIILAVTVLLFLLIPKIDPLKENIKKFYKYYAGFILVFTLFMILIYVQTQLWAFGVEISPMVFLPVGFAGLMYHLSIMFEHAEQNWFIGIRTPWTLSNKDVWDRTHKVGAKLYKLTAIVSLMGILFQRYAIAFILVPILATSFYLVLYSYLEFRKE